MDITIFENGEKIVVTQDQIKRIEEILREAHQASISTKTLSELKGLSFYVKDYQRGYRWTETEIEDLLGDIENIDDQESGYCMQPLVIKKHNCVECEKPAFRLLEEAEEQHLPNNKVYELLDGQQRLSTLYLILSFLDTHISKSERRLSCADFSIYYEKKRPIDKHFLDKARKTIEKWFKSRPKYNRNITNKGKQKKNTNGASYYIEELIKFQNNICKLFFIWYEADKSTSSEIIFKSINEGKIELTNAELFKALLLNPDNLSEDGISQNTGKLQQIAFEWDRIEVGLRDDDFWYFLSTTAVERSSQKTRIDYIIEVYARELNRRNRYYDENKDRFSFLVIQKYLGEARSKARFEAIKKVWEEIVKVYDKLFCWYKDPELYHTIGFLVASEEINRGSKAVVSPIVAELYWECKELSISDTKSHIRKKIFEYLTVASLGEREVEKLRYKETLEDNCIDHTTLKNILLLTNILSLCGFLHESSGTPIASKNQHEHDENQYEPVVRFPFKLYHEGAWDIEHIAPRTLDGNLKKLNGPNDYELFRSSLELIKDNVSDEDKKTINNYLELSLSEENYENKAGYDKCCSIWKAFAEDLNQTPDNRICNLVLLNASINRSYGNAFFCKKREKIIEEDMTGVFIPICTKNVFLKYYSSASCDLLQWTEGDKKAYEKKVIIKMLDVVRGWGK